MTKIEFLLGAWSNIQGLFAVTAVLTGILAGIAALATVFFYVESFDTYNAESKQQRLEASARWRKALTRGLLPIAVVAGLLACLPTMDDLWRVRINLLKLEMASPENVAKAGEHIDTIVKGLECKYLGACGEKKESK